MPADAPGGKGPVVVSSYCGSAYAEGWLRRSDSLARATETPDEARVSSGRPVVGKGPSLLLSTRSPQVLHLVVTRLTSTRTLAGHLVTLGERSPPELAQTWSPRRASMPTFVPYRRGMLPRLGAGRNGYRAGSRWPPGRAERSSGQKSQHSRTGRPAGRTSLPCAAYWTGPAPRSCSSGTLVADWCSPSSPATWQCSTAYT